MELTSDLVTVQGLLKSLEKSTGNFLKIRYKSGNEKKLSLIIKEISDFLTIQKYIVNSDVNPKFHQQLENLVLFLTLNSEFKNDCDIKEYVHLIGICPCLSKCVLLNIILDLNLAAAYCNTIKRFPLIHFGDLVSEIIPTIKRHQPESILNNCFIFLNYFYSILARNSKSDIRDVYEIIIDVSSELLQITTRINPEHVTTMKKLELYKHMGITLIKLLELLYICDHTLETTEKFLQLLVESTCSIMMSVTLNVFCVWAEVKYDEEVLQIIIAEKAYAITEKYQKVESVKDLLQMLVSISKKPKTITEMIQEADNITMISKIYRNDLNQKQWFNALLNTQIMNDKKSMNCIEELSHLCDLTNVDRILDINAAFKTDKINELALKCANNLCVEDLTIACTRYFFKHGLHNALDKDISADITFLLNQSSNGSSDVLTKHILLLYLQNPHQVVDIMLMECLKSKMYSTLLRGVFGIMRDLLQVEQLLYTSLEKLLATDYVLSSDNITNYTTLFNILFETNCITWEKFIDTHLMSYLEDNSEDLEKLLPHYTFLKDISSNGRLLYSNNLGQVLNKTFQILDNARFTFFNFTNTKCALVSVLTQFLMNVKSNVNKTNLITHQVENYIDKYYLHSYNQSEEVHMFDYFFPNINLKEEADATSKILKVVPSCVEHEWNMLFLKMASYNAESTILELLTNVLLLLGQVAKTQKDSENVLLAIKYYLVCYSSVVQNVLTLDKIENQISLCMHLCRIIKELPDNIMEESSLKLIPLMPEAALGKLADDKSFACLLVSMTNRNISQLIAKKVLEYRNL